MSRPSQERPDQAIIRSASERETERFGRLLAELLGPGDVVALNGELGTGKTRLVRAIVAAAGGGGQQATSPTFVLVQQYDTDPPIVHVDAYRLADADELLDLGVEEVFSGEAVCLIEWAARVEVALPPDHLRIDIRATGPQEREFRLSARGPRSRALVRSVEAADSG